MRFCSPVTVVSCSSPAGCGVDGGQRRNAVTRGDASATLCSVDVSLLSAEDYASADRAQHLPADSFVSSPTLFRQMRSWQDFVVGVEAGFDTTWIWEYYSDLICRDWLDSALPLLTPALRALCQPVIERCDARYLAATGPIKPQGPQSSRSSTQGRWWHDRFPLLIDHDEEIPLPPSWSPEPSRLS